MAFRRSSRNRKNARHHNGRFSFETKLRLFAALLSLPTLGLLLWLMIAEKLSTAAILSVLTIVSLAMLLAIAAFWHMQLGMRTIIEDYLAKPFAKGAMLVLNVFVTWAGGAITVLSILKVAFSSSGMSV